MDIRFVTAGIFGIQSFGSWIPKSTTHTTMQNSATRIHCRKGKLKKNHLYPRRPKLPPQFGVNKFITKPPTIIDTINKGHSLEEKEMKESMVEEVEAESDNIWEEEEIEAISLLFQGRIPQKPDRIVKERLLPLPSPHKLRPLGFPTSKRRVHETARHLLSFRTPVSTRIYKDPTFLINLAKQIKDLDPEDNVSSVLNLCSNFLRKGSLSLTIRELGQMGLPERALQVFTWTETQSHLFPDDKVLASIVEVLAMNNALKISFHLEEFITMASRNVLEAMAKGFIKAERLKLGLKLLALAKHHGRIISETIYSMLIIKLSKYPDKHNLAEALMDELATMDNLNLTLQDCTSLMASCVKLNKFVLVEHLFRWFKQSGKEPNVVMYTTMVHSYYCEGRYREAMAIVWEMESSGCLFDVAAYRVVIKLFAAMDDLPRAARYFSKLKDAGFSPTYDTYCLMMMLYLQSDRLAKWREIREEARSAGYDFEV